VFKNKFVQAVLLQYSGIVGAGIFALPYLFASANFAYALLVLITVTLALYFIHQSYADIILATAGDHQLPGYCHKYLGIRAKYLAVFNLLLLTLGTFVVYQQLFIRFSHLFFPHFASWLVFLLYYFSLAIFFLSRSRLVQNFSRYLPFLVLILPLFLFYLTLIYPSFPIPPVSPSLTLFGALVFALHGFTIIPEVEEILRGSHHRPLTGLASLLGLILAAFTYAIFSYAVIRLSGPFLSPDAVSGLWQVSPLLGSLLALLGLLTTFKASLNSLLVLKETFYRDLHFPLRLSFLLPLALPILSLTLGRFSFVQIISLTGAVTLFVSGLLLVSIRFHLPLRLSQRLILIVVVCLLAFGLVSELS
jgi:amino acid permease